MPHPNKVNEARRGYPSSQSLTACITMSVVMRLALPLSPKSIAALQYLLMRRGVPSAAYPYILPLNFGMKVEGELVELYFHGANEGTKYDLIQRDNRASFEMDCEHRLLTDEEQGNCTMEYKSVIGKGHIELLSEEEKYEALCILMQHYHKDGFPFNKDVMPRTTVFKLVVESMTGKERLKKH